MIRQLADPANAITVSGLALSVIAITAVLAGQPELGVSVVLWALLADHLDGVVASRTKGRSAQTQQVGKALDSLADLVSAGIFPAITLLTIGSQSALSVAAATILIILSALRLSYFSAVGLSGGRFIGVPTTYVVPVTAILFLIAPWLPVEMFSSLFATALIVVAALHVLPIRVPRTAGAMYGVVTIFAVLASAVLAMRSLP